jgi:ribosomal protein L37AE/L43A
MEEALAAARWLHGLTLVVVLVAAWFGLQPWLRARRMRAAGDAELTADECAACGSRDVQPVAAAVIRCRACGFVGGEGMAAWHRQARRARLEKLSPEARRRLALDKLREANLQLELARTSLDQAAGASRTDLAGLAFDRGEEKQNALAAALRYMQSANVHATEAVEAVGLATEVSEPMDLEQSGLLRSLDTAWLTDGIFPDLAMHLKIRKARAQLGEMQRAVNRLLQLSAAGG